jgi:glycosyltransferase involved in cell wall biosynthesis
MKVLHINTYQYWGAAKACIRLHERLLAQGVDSKLLSLQVNHKTIASYQYNKKEIAYMPTFRQRLVDRAKRLLAKMLIDIGEKKESLNHLAGRPSHFELFSTLENVYDISQNKLVQDADIINFHWVAGFLDYNSLKKIKKPIVWTLHDMNPFTGGCHYDSGCGKFTTDCSNCPQLEGTINPNLSSQILNKKKEALVGLDNFHVVSPSIWLKEESQKSIFKTYPHYHIPNSFPKKTFQPRDKEFSRNLLDLPSDKKIILFVADSIHNARKGYAYLVEAIAKLNNKNILLCAIGNNTHLSNSPIPCIELGRIEDEKLMSVAYAAADVFVIPSLEDNLPNTVAESLCCGTPVIGFNVGGIPDMVQDGTNGYLCPEISVNSLKQTIEKFLENPTIFDREKISKEAHEKYALEIQAKAYIDLYQRILTSADS